MFQCPPIMMPTAKLTSAPVIPTSNEQVAYCGNALGYHVYLRPTPEP